MKAEGLKGRVSTLYRANPSLHTTFFEGIENRKPKALTAVDQVWVGDLTYLKVAGQWRYLAAVMDLYSRHLLGYALGRRRTVDLTLKALEKAVKVRKPRTGTIFHSDRGIEYAAYEYRDRLKSLGMAQSMNRPRHSEDNAAMESFWHSMKAEVYHGREFASDDELQRVIYPYLDDFYNHRRLHSSLGYKAPVQFEAAVA